MIDDARADPAWPVHIPHPLHGPPTVCTSDGSMRQPLMLCTPARAHPAPPVHIPHPVHGPATVCTSDGNMRQPLMLGTPAVHTRHRRCTPHTPCTARPRVRARDAGGRRETVVEIRTPRDRRLRASAAVDRRSGVHTVVRSPVDALEHRSPAARLGRPHRPSRSPLPHALADRSPFRCGVGCSTIAADAQAAISLTDQRAHSERRRRGAQHRSVDLRPPQPEWGRRRPAPFRRAARRSCVLVAVDR